MPPIPLARYALTARAQQPLPLPDYAGSLLRGQFGAALRGVACMTRQPTCPGCPLLQTCPYTRIFEAPPPPKGSHALQDFSQIPNPYIIEPPTPGARLIHAGDTFEFNIVLVGHATEQLALILFALQRALAQGLTRQRVPCELLQVHHLAPQGQTQLVWTAAQPTLLDHTASVALDAIQKEATYAYSTCATGLNDAQITLHIHTPMRLQHQGQPLGIGQLTPRTLLYAIARRTALMLQFHAGLGGWGEAAQHIRNLSQTLTDTQDLHWFDWTRYSSRQQQEMTLGGVLGSWTLHGSATALAEIYPWLWVGQWLHVGKNATFGMGGYSLND